MNEIKSCIEKVNNNKSGEYEKDYIKIEFNSDDKLPLNKQLIFLSVTIVIRSVFEEDGKYCNWIRTHNHLVHKRTLNHLAKLAK